MRKFDSDTFASSSCSTNKQPMLRFVLATSAVICAVSAFQAPMVTGLRSMRATIPHTAAFGGAFVSAKAGRAMQLRGGNAASGASSLQMNIFAGKTFKDIDGKVVQLEQVAKKVTLVVNVACFCGLTKHYPGLQELQAKFGPEKFTVVAFPCNQFGGQEPGTEAEIKDFVKKFSVSFPIMSKSEVNGPNENAVYKELKKAFPGDIVWNFGKFLVVDGKVVKRYEPTVLPAEIAADVQSYLA